MFLLRPSPLAVPSARGSVAAYIVLLTVFLDACTARRSGPNNDESSSPSSVQRGVAQEVDFLAIDFLLDGERERRLRFRGVSAKETSTGGERGISLRQISDGKHFVQMIHSPRGLVDCDYSRRRKTIEAFLESFKRDSKRTLSVSQSNRTRRTDHDYTNHNHQSSDGNDGKDEDSEDRIRERAKIEEFIENGVLTPEDLDFNWNQRRVGVHNATFVALSGLEQVPRDMRPWLDLGKSRRQCRRKHRELRRDLKRRERQADRLRRMREEDERVHSRSRPRRGLSSYFIAPGTKWCGVGSDAGSYTQLGGFSSVDRCCRAHDDCTNVIGAIESKYDYFNFSPFTMSHCGCDRRFRTCLKLAGGTTAELVGKLFFNVVQTKCFVFKTEKVCTKYTWWKNTCKKYTKKKRAVLRTNMAF